LIGADVDKDIQKIAVFAQRNRIAAQLIDLESAEADAERTVNGGAILGRGSDGIVLSRAA
jgi:hypothetical protein